MDGRIGDELRQERRARGIELEEIEAATGVRARFLEAIEEEEWERLPGEFYVRAFTRTYAAYLGLDPAEFAPERPDPVDEGDDGPRVEPRLVPEVPSARQPRRWVPLAAAAAALALVAAIVLVAALGGGSTRPSPPAAPGERRAAAPPKREQGQPATATATSLRLTATAEVWVCLLNGRRKPLIDGQILPPGAEEGPFHSRRYSMSFGNGAVELTVDGARAKTPESSSPVGFAIDERGKISEIPAGERPECT
ncbi:MAG: helix-turn-helix domain-containing protein [Solirubrobacterales bacterium]